MSSLGPAASVPFTRWPLAGFRDWLQAHRGAVSMAGLLAFGPPVTFFIGDLSVMRETAHGDSVRLGLWWLLYGGELWWLLLLIGFASQQKLPVARGPPRTAIWLPCSVLAVALVNASTIGRAHILIDQGVVQSVQTMVLYSFSLSLAAALLYFAHLRRSRLHELAAARLMAAQAALREARGRQVRSQLQALQARIDPQLLFDMLEAVRQAYKVDARRAELLLDALIAFLRASLPELLTDSSTVPHEVALARAYAGIRALAGAPDSDMNTSVAPEVMHVCCPPGLLMPLLHDALQQLDGPSRIDAREFAGRCRLDIDLPTRPSAAALGHVRALLAELYGAHAQLTLDDTSPPAHLHLELPLDTD